MSEQGRLNRLRSRLGELVGRLRARRRGGGEGPDFSDRPSIDRLDAPAPERLGPRRRARARIAAFAGRLRPRRPSGRSHRLGRLGGVAGGLAAFLGRAGDALRGAGEAAADRWRDLPLVARRRLVALAGTAAAIALVAFVLVPAAPCWFPAGDRCPPPDEAIDLVPAEAAAYVHVNLDDGSEQYGSLAALAQRFDLARNEAIGMARALAGRRINYEREVRPWSDGEAAIAVTGGLDGAETVLMLEVADGEQEAALDFAATLQEPAPAESEFEGVTVRTDRDGLMAAITDSFLLVGPEAEVEAAIAAGQGEDSLADSEAAERLLEELPDHSFAEAYLAPDLVRSFSREGRLGPFNTFVNADATAGVAAALSADGDRVGLAIRSGQDPVRLERSPGFFLALPGFDPKLTDRVGDDALVYLGMGDPAESAAALFQQAADVSPALFSGLERLGGRLRRRDGIDFSSDILPLLGNEAALTVEPETVPGEGEEEEQQEGLTPPTGIPYVALLADDVDVEAAGADLAELQGPIARGIDPSDGQAPVFEQVEIAGTDAHSLRISPVVDLTYAAFDEMLVVGTSRLAVERARSDGDPLSDSELFEAATGDLAEEPSLLLYADIRELLTLGERAFLAEDPAYARLAPDLRQLRAAGLTVAREDELLATDLSLIAGSPEDAESVAPPATEIPGG